MIKVIEGYELNKGADIQPLFLKLRSYAMTFPGFISAEHVGSVKGTPIAAVLYNWERLENWEAWESSKLRQQDTSRGRGALCIKAEDNNI